MLRATGHDHVPLHDGAGGKKMFDSRTKQAPSPFAVTDPRDEEKSTRARPKGSMPPSARPWGREEDLHNAPEESFSPGGKAMGTFKPTAKFDAPFALDPRKAAAPPPGVFGDAWEQPASLAAPLPSVNQSAPFGTDYTAAPAVPEDVADKPWLQQKPAPWDNPDNNHDNFKFGRRILDERPGEAGPMSKDAKAALREELRGQMEAQLHDRKVANEEYWSGGVGAPAVGELRPSKTRPW